jgi:hypothetical protein
MSVSLLPVLEALSSSYPDILKDLMSHLARLRERESTNVSLHVILFFPDKQLAQGVFAENYEITVPSPSFGEELVLWICLETGTFGALFGFR